jgi:acyl dehydratase
LFSGPTAHNLHTDEQVAKDAGLPAPVASATQGMGYLCEFMIDNLGEQWLSGGSWELSFRRPVFPGDQVSALGRMTRPGGNQYTVDLLLVNQQGIRVTQGTATGWAGQG